MEQIKQVLNASVLWRMVDAMCIWFRRQWEQSAVIQWFLNPNGWGEGSSQHSVFYRIWVVICGGLRKVYRAWKLETLFEGSIFLCGWIWCAAVVALAPLLPTMAVLGLALLGFGSLALNLLHDRSQELVYTPINRYIILYVGVYMVGTLASVTLQSSLKPGILSVAFMLFSVVLLNTIQHQRHFDALIFYMVTIAAVVAAYGICQYLFGWGYQSAAWVDSDMFTGISFRVPSTLDNPNMLGQFFILMIPLAGASLLKAKTWLSRLYYLACCGILCVCMILTYSRGAWLGLLFAGAIFVVLLNPRLILLAPFALIALYFVLPETVISRFTSIGNMGDNSTSYRVYIWMGVLAMLREYWVCGIGPGDGAFNVVYPAYSYSGIDAPHAHNLFLQIVCDAGIVALVIFIMLLVVYSRMMCVAISRETNPESRILQIALLSGVGGFMVQAMTDYSFYNYRVMFLFWAYLAVGALAAKRSTLPKGGSLS